VKVAVVETVSCLQAELLNGLVANSIFFFLDSNNGCIICAMALALQATQKDSGYAINPYMITSRLNTICRHLTQGRQEDSHEFLRYLIEGMEKSYLLRFKSQPWFKDLDQYSKETTPLNQILGGYLRSTVTCLSCRHESVTFQHFQDLPLDISRVNSLNEALLGYFSKEDLEDKCYKCESCKKKVAATKKFSLERTPAALCIQLKRFNGCGHKLGKNIQISEDLNLQKFLSKSGDYNQSCKYRLVSMVMHLGGSASGGHYTAIGYAPNGNFYSFDDSYVRQIANEQVLRSNAYILFYEVVKQNGHSIIHQNGHSYSKSDNSVAPPSPITYRSEFDRVRMSDPSFAKPSLPSNNRLLPTSVLRQNQLKQKDNEATSSSKIASTNGPSTSKAPVTISSKVSTCPFPAVKINANGKRNASDEENGENESSPKKQKPTLPSVPRLLDDDDDVDVKKPIQSVVTMANGGSKTPTPERPNNKSLVPYGEETDDEDDEEPHEKKSESPKEVKLCRTSSGVFVETDINLNGCPSKKGSTLENTKVIPTKASQTNGNVNGHSNAKGMTSTANGNHVARGEDAFEQLTKLNHCGYGTSEVKSWSNTPSNMDREVAKDQQEERKRQSTDDDEMDGGRTKKQKIYYDSQPSYNNNNNNNGNQFQSHQNAMNHQSNFPRNQSYNSYNNGKYNRNDRSNNHNGYQQRDHKKKFNGRSNHQNNQNRQGGGGGNGYYPKNNNNNYRGNNYRR